MCIFVSEMKNFVRISFLIVFFFPLLLQAKVKNQLWVIDAGHGGRDVGCEGAKAKEKDINLAVAKRVAELVRANIKGVSVRMTRDTDRYLTLDQRTTIANDAGASLFLSIHVNAAPEAPGVKGTETYYGPIGATTVSDVESARKRYIQKSELLAWEMQRQYGLAGRPISRGVKRERYYVILYTKMPSVLTEIGFISNADDLAYMTSREGQEEIAQSIYKGLKDYKETVDAGKEKILIAEMRRTGGRAKSSSSTNSNSVTNLAKASLTSASATLSASASASHAQADTVVLDPSLEPELDSDVLNFYVQIFALRAKLKPTDKRLKGLKDVKIMEKDGKFKYLAGNTSDYETARKNLADIRKTFPDAFLVAFLGSRQISTADAQEMYFKKK